MEKAQAKPGLIVLDINLPDGSGFEVGTRSRPFESADSPALLGEAIRNSGVSIEESQTIITSEALIDTMKQTLGRLGYDVEGRIDSVEALETFRSRLREKPFDLVIMDMTMPHLTGVELAGELLRLQQGLPILLDTGFSEKMDAEQARSFGIQEFLMKPVVLKELAETVRQILDGRTR